MGASISSRVGFLHRLYAATSMNFSVFLLVTLTSGTHLVYQAFSQPIYTTKFFSVLKYGFHGDYHFFILRSKD